ncbi:hypothetical protein ANO11243_023730 [Dothideomycetidae sp. 11243]|nr:hypothetical protein ANO11243_023730 [fungal sp. No.11243]
MSYYTEPLPLGLQDILKKQDNLQHETHEYNDQHHRMTAAITVPIRDEPTATPIHYTMSPPTSPSPPDSASEGSCSCSSCASSPAYSTTSSAHADKHVQIFFPPSPSASGDSDSDGSSYRAIGGKKKYTRLSVPKPTRRAGGLAYVPVADFGGGRSPSEASDSDSDGPKPYDRGWFARKPPKLVSPASSTSSLRQRIRIPPPVVLLKPASPGNKSRWFRRASPVGGAGSSSRNSSTSNLGVVGEEGLLPRDKEEVKTDAGDATPTPPAAVPVPEKAAQNTSAWSSWTKKLAPVAGQGRWGVWRTSVAANARCLRMRSA